MESGFFDPVHIPLFQKRLFATSDELKRALRPQGLLSSAVMYASTEGIRRESKDEQCKKTARHFIAFDQKAIGLLQKRKGYKQIVADRCIVKVSGQWFRFSLTNWQRI